MTEEKKIRVRFLKSTNLINPEAAEGETLRHFAEGVVAEVTLEEFKKLVIQKVVVPAGEQQGASVSQER